MNGQQYFTLTVNGSNAPDTFIQGDLLVFTPCTTAEPGKLAAIRTDGGEIKATYTPDKMRLIGQAVRLYRDF